MSTYTEEKNHPDFQKSHQKKKKRAEICNLESERKLEDTNVGYVQKPHKRRISHAYHIIKRSCFRRRNVTIPAIRNENQRCERQVTEITHVDLQFHYFSIEFKGILAVSQWRSTTAFQAVNQGFRKINISKHKTI